MGSDGIVLTLAGGIAIAFALWILQSNPLKRWQQAIAAVALLGALWPLNELHNGRVVPTHSAQLSHGWQQFSPGRLEELRNTGTPVLVNLTADWCITCLTNEKVALDRPAVKDALDDAGIVKLKGDWTRYDPQITQLLNQYGRSGVPLYLLFPNGTSGSAKILPQILTEKILIEAAEGLSTENSRKLSAN